MPTNSQAYLLVREHEPIAPGSSVDLLYYTKDEEGTLVAHTSPKITVTKPDGSGNAVTDANMTATDTVGISFYQFDSTSQPEGTYLAVAYATVTLDSTSRSERAKAKFVVSTRRPLVTT